MSEKNQKMVMRVALHTLIINCALFAFKLFAGIFGRSAAMISDAVHSLSDAVTTVVVMVGVKMAARKSDKDHHYGHERMECVTAIVLAVVLIAVGIMIGWEGVQRIMSPEDIPVPGFIALIGALASIAAKEGMYWYTAITAKKAGSGALMADAWHHRSDGLSSIGSFAGILGARLGWPILDPAACLIICAFIVKVGVDIFLDAVGKMTDRACGEETEDALRAVVLQHTAVMGIDLLRTRIFGEKVFMDVEIVVDGSVSLREAHCVAEEVHDAIEAEFPQVKHCMVHINPDTQ
jgi:cation diffusion facilitator family transporter